MTLPLGDETMPRPFYPNEWVELQAALSRIRSITGLPDLALACLNRDLRNGQLGSALVEISLDGKVTMKPLNSSDWQQRSVHAPFERRNGREGYRFEVKPHAAGHYFVRRANLDKWYPDPAMPTMLAAADPAPGTSDPVAADEPVLEASTESRVVEPPASAVGGVERTTEKRASAPSAPEVKSEAPPPDKQPDKLADPDAQTRPRTSRRRRDQGCGTQTFRARAVLKRMCPQGYPTEETESSVDLWERFTKEYEEYKKDESKAGRSSRYPRPSKSVVMREVGRKKN